LIEEATQTEKQGKKAIKLYSIWKNR